MKFKVLTIAALVGLSFCSPNFAQSQSAARQTPPQRIAAIPAPDLAAWRRAETANAPMAYQAYLRQFPNGWFSPLARVRLEPGLPTPLPIPPTYDPNKELVVFIAAKKDYDQAMWQLAQSVGTQKAMAQYLIAVRMGDFRRQATEAYIRLAPVLPAGIAPDCSQEERIPKIVVGFDVARAYPQRAIDREMTDTVRGRVLLHETGLPLAWVDAFYTKPNFFADATERAVLKMLYTPMRAGCAASPFYKGLAVLFWLEGDPRFPDGRPTPRVPDLKVVLDRPSTLQMPEDRALLVEIPHDGSDAIYEVRVNASFRTSLDYRFENSPWSPLFNGTHLHSRTASQLFLRISEEGQPPSRFPFRLAPKPASGPVTVTVTRVYSRPIEELTGSAN